MKHSITFFTGFNCNYKCSYCFQNKIRSNIVLENIDEINKKLLDASYFIKEKILINEELMNGYKNTIQIIGGEPTIYSNIEECIKILCEGKYLKNIRFFSNMSAKIERYLNILEICEKNKKNLDFSCSFHKEFISLNEYKKIIFYLNKYSKKCKSKIKIIPKLVVTNKETIPYLNEYIETFKKIGIKANISPEYTSDDFGNTGYTTYISEELFNYTIKEMFAKRFENECECNCKNKFQEETFKQIIFSSRNKVLKLDKKIKVLPNINIDYNKNIYFPCNNKKISLNELKLENLIVDCDNLKCMLYNECNKI